MKQYLKQGFIPVFFSFFFLSAQAQAQAFNQNSSRSNNRSYSTSSDTWSFGINSGIAVGVNSNENTLFRGNSSATKLFGRYYFGMAGFGLSSGFIPGAINDNSLNNFLTTRKLQRDQVQISTGKPFNGYLAFGPSIRFGNRVQFATDLQGGMFLNNPGSLSISQLGAQRATYRFDGASKNYYPGFSATINIVYPISASTHFFIASDYLQSKSSIRLVDITRGIDIPAEQTRNVKLFTAGIGITKSFGTKRERGSGMATGKKSIGQPEWEDIITPRDVATGQASGRRVLPTVNKREIAIDEPGVQKILSPRDIATGQASGKRLLPTVNKREIAIDESDVHIYEIITSRDIASGLASGKAYQPGQPVYGNITQESCGPVTIKNTYPDGTTEEKTFACPEDAAAFIVNSHAVPGTDVSKAYAVPHVLEQKGMIHPDVAARNILAGRITWNENNSSGIVTNKNAAVSSVTNLGGGASTAAYARNGVATGAGAVSFSKGTFTNIYARETGSGMATGRRTREAGSGMATGRRQYEPLFSEENGNNYNSNFGTVKSNPMYKENGNAGTNPLYESKDKLISGGNNDCDGIAGLTVYLIDAGSGTTVATTQTENCGDFWFANVPSGLFVVKVNGSFMSKKGYDAYMAKSMDIAGELLAADDYWTIDITTDTGSVEKAQAIIRTKTKSNQSNDRLVNTSRSNIKNIVVATGDADGDGMTDMLVGSTVAGFGEKINAGLHAAGGALAQGAALLGGALPGGAVISAACRPGDPIPGIDVKIYQNANQTGRTKTNQSGEFEFTNLKEGNYTITTQINYDINDETLISVGDDTIGENINTSESNLKGDARIGSSQNSQTLRSVNNINGGMPNRISMNVTVPKQTQGATFGEKANADLVDNNNPTAKARNNNTVRSNRTDNALITDVNGNNEVNTISITEPGKWIVPETMKATINTSRSNIKHMAASLDELEQMLSTDNTTAKSIINTSRSNIKNQRVAMSNMEETLNTMETIEKNVAMAEIKAKMVAMNMQFLSLQKSVDAAGKQYASISNVLKTKHDTVKNSIGNIR